VIIPVTIDTIQRGDRATGCHQPGRPMHRLRQEVLAAARGASDKRAGGATGDPWLDTWRKLLAKYRRR